MPSNLKALEDLIVFKNERTQSDHNLESFLNHFTQDQENSYVWQRKQLDPLSLFKIYIQFSPKNSRYYEYLQDTVPSQTSLYSSMTDPIDISKYVQNVEIPRMIVPDAQTSENFLIGKYPINGSYLTPDNNNLIINVLNTKDPILDNVFYPWMREETIQQWIYDSQPYTTATITIDHSLHSNVKYVFYGCRPQSIEMQKTQQNQTGENLVRQIVMKYDVMCIQSEAQAVQVDDLDEYDELPTYEYQYLGSELRANLSGTSMEAYKPIEDIGDIPDYSERTDSGKTFVQKVIDKLMSQLNKVKDFASSMSESAKKKLVDMMGSDPNSMSHMASLLQDGQPSLVDAINNNLNNALNAVKDTNAALLKTKEVMNVLNSVDRWPELLDENAQGNILGILGTGNESTVKDEIPFFNSGYANIVKQSKELVLESFEAQQRVEDVSYAAVQLSRVADDEYTIERIGIAVGKMSDRAAQASTMRGVLDYGTPEAQAAMIQQVKTITDYQEPVEGQERDLTVEEARYLIDEYEQKTEIA